jgi:acetolactate synthase-1/2/3 large subunit
MSTAEFLVRMLAEAGVRWVFGIPSGPVLPLIEALRKSPVEFVLTASESSAGFMAQTVGALTGVPGACVSTLGPGATNLATGVGSAWLDRSPLVAITCNVATPWLRRRVQMRIDHHALFQPLTKASFAVRAEDAAETFARALALSRAEPPGPVHLDLPEDVAHEKTIPEARSFTPGDVSLREAGAELSETLASALGKSRKPLVVTGLTFCRAKKPRRLLRFIETQNIPFISTLHAKGFLPESHPNWAGVLGRARRTDVQAMINAADLIIAVGFDPIEINYEEWAGETPVIHLSNEAAETGPDIKLLCNVPGDLDDIIGRMGEIRPAPNDWSAAELAAHREKLERALRPQCNGLAPHHTIDLLRKKIPADAILAYDVGAHTHQIATQWRTDVARTCLATNGWSSMGYGMPAAYAAKLLHPDRVVVAVVGDGCFQMTAGELALARRLGLAVPVIVLNDGWLGLMKVKQERKGYGLSGVRLGAPPESPPHYFGVPCRPAKNEKALGEALDWALDLKGPSVIEAFIDVEPYSETVFD